MRLIKRLWLRFELSNARYQIKHWASEISAAANDNRVSPADVAFMMNMEAEWILTADDIAADLYGLDVPDHDDIEQLSSRAIAPAALHWRK